MHGKIIDIYLTPFDTNMLQQSQYPVIYGYKFQLLVRLTNMNICKVVNISNLFLTGTEKQWVHITDTFFLLSTSWPPRSAYEYEKCAQGLTNELTIWHLLIMANQLTHLFVLVSWSGGYTYDYVISIYRVVFPTHMYCTTANNFADMQSFEEAMVWGAVTFVKCQ